VEDDSFNWKNAKKCLDKVQNLHPKIPDPTMKKYVNPKPGGIKPQIIRIHSITRSTY